MRALGIDHGTKRMGVALSDELKFIAQPAGFLPAEPEAECLAAIRTLVGAKEVDEVIVGMPRNMDGSYGPAAAKVREFVTALGAVISVPIRTWDERLTSAQANRVLLQANVSRQDRKVKVDQMAAAILLQSYLDSRALA